MVRCVILVVSALCFVSAASGSTIRLQSPQDYEVIQRDTDGKAYIPILGEYGFRSHEVEFRVDGSAWRVVQSHGTGHLADRTLMTTGGWHTFEIRIVGDTEVTRVGHVGVGEVFVIAGQSNSTNYGAEKQKPHSGMVSTFDGQKWRIADDPQPGVQDHSTGGSFIPAFGDALVQKLHVPIGIASVGCGATSVREWLPRGTPVDKLPTTGKHMISVGDNLGWTSDGMLYAGLIGRVKQLPNGCAAILWHQGESDAGQARAGYPADRQISGKEYHDYLKRIIEQSQKDSGRAIPWFVAQATYHSEADPVDEEFRAAQKQLWTERIAQQGPDTDQLRAEYRNGVHMNAKGLNRHGELWAEKVLSFVTQ